MMVGLIIMGGYLLRTGLMAINPFFSNLPLFACCLIFSAVFCICTQKSAKINDMIDRPTVVRISGTALGVPDRLRSGYHKPGRVCHLRRPPDRGLHRSLHRHLLGLLHPGQAGLAQERPV